MLYLEAAIFVNMEKKKILVCVMNWGLGHATRCIPIITELQVQGFIPLLASDGSALSLLRKEFPELKCFELPSYNITYTQNPKMLMWKLFLQTPHILETIKAEKKMVRRILEEENIDGIISDNRFGARSKKVHSVYITHQLNVLSGNLTYFSSKIHQYYIRKFDECWVPDSPGKKNLSGILGHLKKDHLRLKYIGPISRFKKKPISLKYDYLVLLSGPEPQRSLLQDILFKAFRKTSKKLFFVRGVVTDEDFTCLNPNMTIKNYLFGKELEEVINSSRMVISRSGYTTLLDLAKLEKRAFFIPTPGQNEQEYLAERLKRLGIAAYCNQDEFHLDLLKEEPEKYSGLENVGFTPDFRLLFTLFERK